MSLTAYITATPLDSGFFKDIYSSLREFKSRFKERFELDHYMGGVVDDTDPTCEGYHKQLTMNGGEYDASNIPTTIPSCPTGGIVFFSIGGELCCYDGDTAKQITDDGGIATGGVVDEVSGLSTSVTINDVCYGGGLYVAVGTSGKIITSPDGVTWTSRTSGTTNLLQGICYDGSKFVACGGSIVLTSSDGITWSPQTFSDSQLTDICYGDSLFIMTRTGLGVYTSPDGVTWTSRDIAGLSRNPRGVCYGDGVYILVTFAQIMSSSDGINWTERVNDSNNYVRCCYNESVFVATGEAGIIVTSPDGVTWTSRTSGTTTDLWGVCGTTSLFVITGDSGLILISADAITWESKSSGVTSHLRGCCYGDDLFIISGASAKILSFTKYITLP